MATEHDVRVGDFGAGLLFQRVEAWRGVQAAGLVKHLEYAAGRGLYRGMDFPRAISAENLDAVVKALPLTSKDQLAAAGSGAWAGAGGGAGAGAGNDVAEWVCTSGTLGRPVDVPLTRGDLRRLALNEAAALSLAGIRRGDLVILAVGMERMFVAGLAYWLGCQEIGAACVRTGPQVAAHGGMLREMVGRCGDAAQRVFVIAVPSFLRRVEALGEGRHLAGIVAIGEATRTGEHENLTATATAAELASRFACPVMSTYALTETCTTFAEGPLCIGGHLNPALAIVECMDEQGRATREGEVGEIVVTPLGVEGLPLVRFRTGDMAALFSAPCRCGRTTPRIGPIVGRRQQLLKVRGTSIYPGAIVEALRNATGVLDCVVIAEREGQRLGGEDRVTVCIAWQGEDADAARRNMEGRLRSVLRVLPELRLMTESELRALQGGGRKATRFIDRRTP